MLIAFNPEKTTQAAAVILKLAAGQRMGRLRLLKLLYLADRESIQDTGYPITGDDVTARDDGPVLNRICDCMKGGDVASPQWEQFIERVGPREVKLLADPGLGKLSRYEVRKLQEVAQRWDAAEDYEIVDYLHTLPEWKDNAPPPGSSRPIPVRDILQAVGHGEHQEAILEEAHTLARFDQATRRTEAK